MAPTRIADIEYAAMPRAGTRAAALAWPPRLVVIHDTGNNGSTRYNEASYAATRTDASSGWTSAHCYTDTGGVLGSLPLNLQAWAAYSYANAHGFHIEMCRTAAGVLPATVANTTPIVRWLCQQAGIPMVKLSPTDVAAGKSGICGHYDITVGLGVGDHTDPGVNFDWATFMAQVTGGGDDMLADERAWVNNADKYGWAAAALLDPVPNVQQANGQAGSVPNLQAQLLKRTEAKVDAVLKALGVAQADLDELQARPALQLTDEQAAGIADRIATALAAHPDTPLGDADKPAIVEAVKTALREGLGQ